ncbi:hypothetical protein CL1_0733 [Thermococcus cleftensis]|uniref:HEAT repeat domain-containing protein n=1 Tax=Thermococcus cleftensis (strain DSM 27260 / KACC 17922 / CL1) TaxID=163003 RepID=I3ZTA4_THECF|nr:MULTISPECIES: hypothetical protein [Thermococcus]AFL94938.1 hypothetical protein CL1_0733 [Thermococcus cleftensis]NJE03739.1 hypothetical protein [Thermococcus sp. MV11]
MNQIEEIIKSWRALDVVKLASTDRSAVLALLELLSNPDTAVRLRTLAALAELVEGTDDGTKKFLLNHGLEPLTKLLSDDDPRVVHRTIEVLARLLKSVPLDEKRFLQLLNSAVEVMKNGDTLARLSLIDLFGRIQVPSLSEEGLSKVHSIASSDFLWVRLLGLRVLLSSGRLEGYEERLVEGLESLLLSGNALTIELGIGLLMEIMRFHSTPGAMKALSRFPSILKAVETGGGDVFLRRKAAEARKNLEETLLAYYGSRHDEALEAARALLGDGRGEDALFLLFTIGRTDLLSHLWGDARAAESEPMKVLGLERAL